MRPEKLRELGDAELGQTVVELREALFRVRMRRATGQVENKMAARVARRELARALTIQDERARAAAKGSQA